MQQIMRLHDKTAKVDPLDMFNDSTALWIPDFCQKKKPTNKIQRRTILFFWEKRQMLHVDAFLMKPQTDKSYLLYLCMLQRC